ncbi:MAG: hypothetical protein FWC39_05515 [Bacteroidetes bacterium]|nr:hypothetical protein [Bacteroidota bacterium]
MQTRILFVSLFIFFSATTFAQKDSVPERKFSVSTPWLSFANFGEAATNTHHYELHFKYDLTSKDKIGLKFATWSLFQPMGIQWWDGLTDMINKESELYGSEFYPGRLRETGLGVSYQRMLWKGLFAAIEVLPQLKTYVDEDKNKIGNGFKLYTSYHIGYHIPLFKNRFFIEPQIHCQNWLIDTNTPQEFKEINKKWKNYFLFEPNLYIGFKF